MKALEAIRRLRAGGILTFCDSSLKIQNGVAYETHMGLGTSHIFITMAVSSCELRKWLKSGVYL